MSRLCIVNIKETFDQTGFFFPFALICCLWELFPPDMIFFFFHENIQHFHSFKSVSLLHQIRNDSIPQTSCHKRDYSAENNIKLAFFSKNLKRFPWNCETLTFALISTRFHDSWSLLIDCYATWNSPLLLRLLNWGLFLLIPTHEKAISGLLFLACFHGWK